MTIFPALAQCAIDDIITALVSSGTFGNAMDRALEVMAKGLEIERITLWQVCLAELTVTNEYSEDNSSNIIGSSLDCMESTQMTLNFLSDKGLEHSVKVIDSESEMKSWNSISKFCTKYSRTVVAPLIARGMVPGFLLLQACAKRQWTETDLIAIDKVTSFLALLTSYEFEIAKLKA